MWLRRDGELKGWVWAKTETEGSCLVEGVVAVARIKLRSSCFGEMKLPAAQYDAR
jgi:hypothetical protein